MMYDLLLKEVHTPTYLEDSNQSETLLYYVTCISRFEYRAMRRVFVVYRHSMNVAFDVDALIYFW